MSVGTKKKFVGLYYFLAFLFIALLPQSIQAQSATVNVSSVSELKSAINSLISNETILLADGIYDLTGTLYLPPNISNVTIKGASGHRDAVVIRGNGMSGTIPFGFWANNVNGVTFANVTIRDFQQHGIILNGRVDNPA